MRRDAEVIPARALDALVVVVRNADEHPEVGAFLEIEHEPGVFDRLPRRLEQQPVLRIDVGRFARRDAEELRIELVDPVDEPAALGDRLAGDARLGIDKSARRSSGPAALQLTASRPSTSSFQNALRVIDAAGKTAADSDDGDAVFVA